jgi:opacity protein-like surface antigen
MKTKRGVLSRIGLSLILATILLHPFTFAATSNAQEMPDVIGVRLNDGTVIEGTVIKANTDIVTIRTKDNQIVTRKFSDVENFIKTGESLAPAPRTRYDESPFYAGIFGGYVIPNKLDVDVSGGSYKVSIDNNWMIGIKLGANIPTAPFCNLEIEYNYMSSQHLPEQTTYSGANYIQVGQDSNVYLNNILFNFVLRYPAGNIRPYLGAGAGWSQFNIGGNYTALINGTTYSAHDASSNAFAFQFLAGINFRIDKLVSLDAGYRYFVTQPTVAGVDVSYQANIFTLGLNYHFW